MIYQTRVISGHQNSRLGEGGVSDTPLKPYKLGVALWYAIILWFVGFVWGMIVFAVPSLKNVPSIPYVSKYPSISFVLLPLYLFLTWLLARRYLRSTSEKTTEGIKLGAVIVLVTAILDTLAYVVLLAGTDYFAYLSIWVAYVLFLFVPWFAGKRS